MRINIVMRAKLSEVVGTSEARATTPTVPYSIWVILGDFEPDDEDGFDLHPLYETDPETGASRQNERYLMGSLANEEFEHAVAKYYGVQLIETCRDLRECIQTVKNLRDIFVSLEQEVLLLETCDY